MTCRGCRSRELEPVFHMDPMPLAGGFTATAAAARAMPKYPLEWFLCHVCGLVNVYPDIPDDDIYRTYSYAASTVPALVRHHAAFAEVLKARYPEPIRLLEIGGNDGVLLDQLPRRWERWNVDPSDVAYRASDSSWELIPEPFTADLALGLPATFDVVTSSNAFAHFSDIAGAIEGVHAILKPGGEFWLEVHSLEATLRGLQWDTIYHEHKVEWSKRAIEECLWRAGFDLIAHYDLPLHGGLIRSHWRKAKRDEWPTLPLPSGFDALQESYDGRRPPPLMPHSAAYGAAARGTVYLNQMPGLPIDYVVDGSPVRAGKFVPGLGIPILSPDVFDADQPETTLITAWNHWPDIQARHPGYTGWVTAW